MKDIAVIKLSRVARSAFSAEDIAIICDPDACNIALASYLYEGVPICADFSEAIRRSDVKRIALTIQDRAESIALVAVAYRKNIIIDSTVKLGNRIATLAALKGVDIVTL